MNDNLYHNDPSENDETRYAPDDESMEGAFAVPMDVDIADFEYVPHQESSLDSVTMPTEEQPPVYDPLQIDIDSALAAVTTLDDLLVEPNPTPSIEPNRIPKGGTVAVPRTLKLGRGNPLSLMSGFVTVAVGGWLTYQWTAGQTVPMPTLILLLSLIPITFFLVAWLWGGRWARGVFVAGMSLSAFSIAQYYAPLLQWSNMSWLAYGFFTFGVILFLMGILSRPFTLRTLYGGVVFGVIGAMVRVVEYGYIPTAWLQVLLRIWYLPIAIFALIVILPFFRRRNPR